MDFEEIKDHIKNGCSYGQPSGPDDYITECECDEEEIKFSNICREITRLTPDQRRVELKQVESIVKIRWNKTVDELTDDEVVYKLDFLRSKSNGF